MTGAARGIGAAIAEVLARDGAHVVGSTYLRWRRPRRRDRIGGRRSSWTSPPRTRPRRSPAHLRAEHGGVDVVVHNAGVTRDKTLGRMTEEQWGQVLDINLSSEERINDALLEAGMLREHGRIVCVSSISGIAGNAGQTNYATSKAGVIGMVEALAPAVAGARRDDQRGGARLHRDPDDRQGAARAPRGRPADEQPVPGRPAGGRGGDDRVVRAPGLTGSTATSSACAARACWGPDGITAHLRPRGRAARPAGLAAAVRGGRRRRDARARAREGGRRGRPRAPRGRTRRSAASRLRDTLPATYPHVLAFDLHMELMTDGRFPFPAIGLVHIANSIEQLRPIDAGERLDLRAYPTPHRAAPARARPSRSSPRRASAGEVVWKGHSTMLRRGGGDGSKRERAPRLRGAARRRGVAP